MEKEALFDIFLELQSVSSQQKVLELTNALSNLSRRPEYLEQLLCLINSPNISFEITVSALAQLKNFVRQNWPRQLHLESSSSHTTANFQSFINYFVFTFQNLCDNFRYSKILIDITSIIGRTAISTLAVAIEALMKQETQIRAALMILLGVTKSFRFCSNKHQLVFFHQLLSDLMPLTLQKLTSTDQKEQFWQFCYLTAKIACKSLNAQTFGSLSVTIIQIAKLCTLKLYSEAVATEPAASWEQLHKATASFYVWHARKWVMKLFQRIVQYILVPEPQKLLKEICQGFSNQLLHFLLRILKEESFTKIQFYQLRNIQKIIIRRPDLFLQHPELTEELLSIVLPNIIKLSPIDKFLAQNEPSVFIDLEDSCKFAGELESPRRIAVQVWFSLATIDLNNFSTATDCFWLKKSFNLISRWALMGGEQEKQVALHLLKRLLLQLKSLDFLPFYEDLLPYFSKIAQQESGWVFIRVLQLVPECSRHLDTRCLLLFRDIIFKKLLNQTQKSEGLSALFVIRAAFCVDTILQREQVCQSIPSETVVLLLQALLRILNEYEFPEILKSFRHVIMRFTDAIIENASELVVSMQQLISFYLQKSHTQTYLSDLSNEFNENYFGIVSNSVQVLLCLADKLQSRPRLIELQKALEIAISALLYDVLSKNPEEYQEFVEILLPLLSTYLQALPGSELSHQIWLLFKILVFRIAKGSSPPNLSLQFFSEIKTVYLPFNELRPYGLQAYLRVFRAFARHLPINPHYSPRTFKDIFKKVQDCSHLQLFLYLIASYFQIDRIDPSRLDQGKVFATLQLIYLLQIHGSSLPRDLWANIFSFVLAVIARAAKKNFMTKYALQLFCVWIFHGQLEEIYKNFCSLGTQKFHRFIGILFNNNAGYGLRQILGEQERRRTILGLGKLLCLILEYQSLKLMQMVDLITSWLIYLTRQTCKARKPIDQDRSSIKEELQTISKSKSVDNNEDYQEESQSITKQITNWDCPSIYLTEEDDFELDEQIASSYFNQSLDHPQLFTLQVLQKFNSGFSGMYNQIVWRSEDNNQNLADIIRELQPLESSNFYCLVKWSSHKKQGFPLNSD